MDYYDTIAGGYDELHKEEQLRKLSILKDEIKIGRDTKLLDVGCGTGISSGFDCMVIGLDPSSELLKQNRNGLAVLGMAEEIPFKNNSFDYVVSVTAIHNFNDIAKAMREIKRVGKKDFVFSVLSKSGKFSQIKKIIESNFRIAKIVAEQKDTIFFCTKP